MANRTVSRFVNTPGTPAPVVIALNVITGLAILGIIVAAVFG
ncbi:hypothetical protein [Pseudomonas sp. PA15(2017)]|nr:hypothetical protein [Pseudomonas sp. PA15(2017)]